jgi:predicted enzyme related to lactoylglutathione lyase
VVQYVLEVLQLDVEIKIKVTDLHFSDIKRTVKFYSSILHVYVRTYDRMEEEHFNIY